MWTSYTSLLCTTQPESENFALKRPGIQKTVFNVNGLVLNYGIEIGLRDHGGGFISKLRLKKQNTTLQYRLYCTYTYNKYTKAG